MPKGYDKKTGRTYHCEEGWAYYDGKDPIWKYDGYRKIRGEIKFEKVTYPKFCPNCGKALPSIITTLCDRCGSRLQSPENSYETIRYCSLECAVD